MTVDSLLTVEELRRHYGEGYFRGEEYIDYVADKVAQQRTLAEHLRVVRRYVPAGARVLEIGCAYGYFLELIRSTYPRSVGIDVSREAVAAAQAMGLDARVGDLLESHFDSEFDAVCLWDTIEHLPHPEAVVGRCAQLLKRGGHLFLTTGDFGALMPRLQGLKWRQIHPPTHVFYFTRPSLRALCERSGLDDVRFTTVRVHRRLSSALSALERFHAHSLAGRAAARLLRLLPSRCLDWDIPLDLGDTLSMTARRR